MVYVLIMQDMSLLTGCSNFNFHLSTLNTKKFRMAPLVDGANKAEWLRQFYLASILINVAPDPTQECHIAHLQKSCYLNGVKYFSSAFQSFAMN